MQLTAAHSGHVAWQPVRHDPPHPLPSPGAQPTPPGSGPAAQSGQTVAPQSPVTPYPTPGSQPDPTSEAEALALRTLRDDFTTFDTARQQDPSKADGVVSRNDLKAVVQGPGYSAEQKQAAQYLLDHPDAYYRADVPHDHAAHGASDGADGYIARNTVEDLVLGWELDERKRVFSDNSSLKTGIEKDMPVNGHAAALGVVDANRAEIEEMAKRYGIDPALLAGVLAAEVDFDHNPWDVAVNTMGELFGPAYRLDPGGPGVAETHAGTVERSARYLVEHRLPGADRAGSFKTDAENLGRHSVEAAAIVLAELSHRKQAAGGTVHTPRDMAILYGAYRNGFENEATHQPRYDWVDNRLLEGNGIGGVGNDAYLSEPYFAYYDRQFG
ncbi:hypothetical protein [Caldimonas brevitalea]|uniref:Uncharacterized protein n=1 Tax=Caldimonas brevitalea TaxID=413882 RepID=A0A0G3BX29_9BURK|nr:hypothetical protein [Caldimonas brevitalea]AKJ31921.1 hypothetical protein AAW51_5230 [Caldimonas brevitalea]